LKGVKWETHGPEIGRLPSNQMVLPPRSPALPLQKSLQMYVCMYVCILILCVHMYGNLYVGRMTCFLCMTMHILMGDQYV
jgi:hypothetical protein